MVAMKLLSLDSLFHATHTDKIILNNYVVKTTEDVEDLKNKLNTIYNSDTISLLPRCECGAIEVEFMKGQKCPDCDTIVKSIYDDTNPFIWFKAVANTDKFISPEFWAMFKKIIGGNIDFLRWISDTQYNPPITTVSGQKVLSSIKSINSFERSYTWLVKNLKTLLVTLAVTLNKESLAELLVIFKENKKKILSNHLPLQNKRMFIIEESPKNKYTNLKILDVLDIVLFFIKNCNAKTQNKREQVMSRTCAELANIYEDSISTYLAGKGGIPRKHINGFRSYFTARAVIVPIVTEHKYNTVELPWSIVVVMMRPHILNKLFKRGYSYVAANNLLYKSVEHYDEVINEIIDEMLEESEHGGFPIVMNRNPSLLNGSSQTMLGDPKRDPTDKTTGFSILTAKNPNADYDGDEMNIQLLVDEYLYKLFKPMEPHASVADMSTPGGVSGRLSLTDPLVSTISNYLFQELQELKK